MPQDKIQRNQIDKVVEFIDLHLKRRLILRTAKVKIAYFPECSTVNRYHMGSYIEGIPETWQDLYRWGNARSLFG
ncbi:hypothetical protein ACQCWA_13320 [Rossellomorea aquimaris]|uniref:hypothetical protein n=1 Tax=Rossellomorea aquimaris TaxID=189382 RepID=UPI003CFB4896